LERSSEKVVGRNEPCPCGSGKKYKQCCLDKDEARAREARAKAHAETTEAPPTPAAPAHGAPPAPRQKTHQPWKKGAANTRGFQRVSAPRKVGSG
jgi:hypothetical protein